MEKKYKFEKTGFESYVNNDALVVIVGVTPGNNQIEGKNEIISPLEKKKKYAFKGEPMRSNLIKMLDLIGVNKVLGIQSCKTIWDNDFRLVEMTSLLKRGTYEIIDGKRKMFNKAKNIAGNSQLEKEFNNGFVKDCAQYQNAKLFVACGPDTYTILLDLFRQGIIRKPIVGIAHPSGQNGNWVNCYLKKKQPNSETLKRCEKLRDDAISKIQFMTNL